MTERLRELLGKPGVPSPWASQASEDEPPNALVYGPDGDSFAYLSWNPGNDYDVVATAAYVAACDPDTIRALLDAHDRMAAALDFIAEWAADCARVERENFIVTKATVLYRFADIERQARAALAVPKEENPRG